MFKRMQVKTFIGGAILVLTALLLLAGIVSYITTSALSDRLNRETSSTLPTLAESANIRADLNNARTVIGRHT